MRYKQLALEERYQIYSLYRFGHSQAEIARVLGRHKSTISRELRRNRGERDYRARLAHRLATCRRQRCRHNARRLGAQQWRLIECLLKRQWSPQQIAGRLELLGYFSVSAEWIYQYVLRNKTRGGTLHCHLRCQRQRKKRYGVISRQGQIAGRTSIDLRPAIVDRRERYGDWELDTLFGKGHSRCLLSLTERLSRLTLLAKLPRRSPDLVARRIVELLSASARKVHTLTADNGAEFALHAHVARALQAKFYFAHPHAAWERGTNENTNGLIRQYVPKGTDLRTGCSRTIRQIVERLNSRPRKCLGWRTPFEVFFNVKPVAL
jgi:IS30 family transposase